MTDEDYGTILHRLECVRLELNVKLERSPLKTLILNTLMVLRHYVRQLKDPTTTPKLEMGQR